jgi:hypothetical protein
VNSDQTRAAYEGGTISSTNPLTALVLTSLNSKDYTKGANLNEKLRCEGIMTFDGSDKVAYNKPVMYGDYRFSDYSSNSGKSHYMTGLYPAAWIVSGGDRTLELTGKEDVMLATEVTTNYTKVKGNEPATLAFTHQLTLLKLKFIKESAVGDIKLQSAKVVDMLGGLKSKAVAKISQNSQEVTFEPSAASIACYKWNTDAPLENADYQLLTSDNVYGYTLVPPVMARAGADEYEFHINYTVEGDMTSQKVYVDLKNTMTSLTGDSKGKAYTITFKFVDGGIESAASVAVWDYTWGDGEFDI